MRERVGYPYDIDNTARILNVSPRTVRRWVESGKLKGKWHYQLNKIVCTKESVLSLKKQREESGILV